MERRHDIVDDAIVRDAITKTLNLFADEGLTIAEAIKVAMALDRTFKANNPEVYRVMAKAPYDEPEIVPIEAGS